MSWHEIKIVMMVVVVVKEGWRTDGGKTNPLGNYFVSSMVIMNDLDPKEKWLNYYSRNSKSVILFVIEFMYFRTMTGAKTSS